MDKRIHILSTKTLGNVLVNTAADNGIEIEEKSFISIEPLKNKTVTDRILRSLNEKLNVVFTSANAVHAVSVYISSKPDWNVYCIGNATKELVAKMFGEDSIAATASHAIELAERIISHKEKGVRFFCGDQRRDELPDILRGNGIKVEECIVYKTVLTPSLVHRPYDGILFFSPTAVESFFSLNSVTKDTCTFALGETTLSAIKKFVSNEVILATHTSKESLIARVIEYYKLRKSTNATIEE